MPRTKPFAGRYVISNEALRMSAVDLRSLARANIENQTESRGPRGGRSILGPVNSWVELQGDDFSIPETVILGYRTGTYVRPRHDAPSERRSATTAKAMR